ncbi:hypothetical protein LOZ66_006810 [Ophidiomyces ophidiicola]|nr:hypothetical protein LOZ66_006810 [Ophidiomyces ophidiicola]
MVYMVSGKFLCSLNILNHHIFVCDVPLLLIFGTTFRWDMDISLLLNSDSEKKETPQRLTTSEITKALFRPSGPEPMPHDGPFDAKVPPQLLENLPVAQWDVNQAKRAISMIPKPKPKPQKRKEWSSKEKAFLAKLREKKMTWEAISSHFPGTSPDKC